MNLYKISYGNNGCVLPSTYVVIDTLKNAIDSFVSAFPHFVNQAEVIKIELIEANVAIDKTKLDITK